MNWNILNPNTPENIEQLKQVLMVNRDLDTDDAFFSPPHPQDLAFSVAQLNPQKVKQAVERLLAAIKNKETVVIFGDYDADGVCATAILWQTLYDLGAEVKPFIPHREKYGYGLSDKALDDLLLQLKPDLIVTVDNGIVAHQPAQRVEAAGIDLIITDHHQLESKLPPATAIVHSTQLCGATISWMLAREVMTASKKKLKKDWQLDLTAIATIADQVPLRGANRSFAKHGLRALARTQRLGLKALFKQAGIKQSQITAQVVGFGIAPRVNAMGRLGHSLDSLRLLLTTNSKRAIKLAQNLDQTNTQRQELTYEMYGQALSQSDSWKQQHLIIVHSPDYHEGVVGLIAGRLAEQFHKPAIAMSVGDEVVKASARSVPGVNIVELIRQIQDELLEVGGHPMAAGFGLKTEKLDIVITRLQQLAKKVIDQTLLQPTVDLEAVLPTGMINQQTLRVINKFAPFGQGNPEPIFGFKNIEVLQVLTMGQDNQHLKLIGRIGDQPKPINFLYWRHGQLADKIQPGKKVDLAGSIEINEWGGKKSMQIRLIDVEY